LPVVTPENLFARPVSSATVGQIILWWEARRLYYNGIILAWALLWGTITQLRKTRDWVSSPLPILTYLFGVQLPANIFFTGGWIADLVVKKVLGLASPGFGPWAFGLGTGFSFLFILVVIFL
jgi:hypothetical protein